MFIFCLSLQCAGPRSQIPYTQHCCVYNHVTFDYDWRCLPARMSSCIPHHLAKFGSSWVKLKQLLDLRKAESYKQKSNHSTTVLASVETSSPLARWSRDPSCQHRGVWQSYQHGGTTGKTYILLWLHLLQKVEFNQWNAWYLSKIMSGETVFLLRYTVLTVAVKGVDTPLCIYKIRLPMTVEMLWLMIILLLQLIILLM